MNRFALGIAAFVTLTSGILPAQLDIPSDGTDGILNIAANTTIDLGAAITGNWQDPVPEEHKGKGIYDPSVWAVVYKYESVTVNSGTTVGFKNHPSGAPVVWLVDGDVVINGTVSVSANNFTPGPGGFHGGRDESAGYGPGGGDTVRVSGISPSGSYATQGSHNTMNYTYGNSAILPLIGGSGGAAYPRDGYFGGGGGGAILIAAPDSFKINGTIRAIGGVGVNSGVNAGHGSGGAIRVIANKVEGSGSFSASGGALNSGVGGEGRIRVEARKWTMTSAGTPNASFAAPDDPPRIFPDNTAPIIRSIRLGGRDVPLDPEQLTYTPEMSFDEAGDYDLEIEAMMVPEEATIEVRITPANGPVRFSEASFVSGNLGSSLWQATTTLPEGRMEIQARAVLPASTN